MDEMELFQQKIKVEAKECIKLLRKNFLKMAGADQKKAAINTFNFIVADGLFSTDNPFLVEFDPQYIADMTENDEYSHEQKHLYINIHVARVACSYAAKAFLYYKIDTTTSIFCLSRGMHFSGLFLGLSRGLNQSRFEVIKRNKKAANKRAEETKKEFEPIRIKVIELWENRNSPEGKRLKINSNNSNSWKSYAECATKICDLPEICKPHSTVLRWISDHNKSKKQAKT